MAYGYYSPSYNGYMPNYQQQGAPQMLAQATPQNQGIVWVQGESGAKSYLMAPNSTALLMDSEQSRMYIKSTDGAGMPTMRVFEYKEVGSQPQSVPDYVSRCDFNALKNKVDEIVDWMDKSRPERPEEVTEGGKNNGKPNI